MNKSPHPTAISSIVCSGIFLAVDGLGVGLEKMAKEIPRASQKRLLRLISARADIQYSQAAYHAFRGSEEPSLRYSTFLAMVISYMRPFTENHGLGRLQCEFPDYPDFDLPEAGVRHQRMIDLRNKFLGHGGFRLLANKS